MVLAEKVGVRISLLIVSFLFIISFLSLFVVNAPLLTSIIDVFFNYSIKFFGYYWQLLLVVNFLLALCVLFHSSSRYQIGGDSKEYSDFKWISMIVCAVMGGSTIIWAAGEPIAHYMISPHTFEGEVSSISSVHLALAQSFFHWGFIPWAIEGVPVTIV